MTFRLQKQLEALDALCERIEYNKLCLPGGHGGDEHFHMFIHTMHEVSDLMDKLSDYISPLFILSSDQLDDVRKDIISMACGIVFNEYILNRDLEARAAMIKSDERLKGRAQHMIQRVVDTALGVYENYGNIPHMLTEFPTKFAVSVILEDLLLDSLGMRFMFQLDVPFLPPDREDHTSQLTAALIQLWKASTDGYIKVTNFLKCVHSAIHPGALDEFRDSLKTEADKRKFEACVAGAGLSELGFSQPDF